MIEKNADIGIPNDEVIKYDIMDDKLLYLITKNIPHGFGFRYSEFEDWIKQNRDRKLNDIIEDDTTAV